MIIHILYKDGTPRYAFTKEREADMYLNSWGMNGDKDIFHKVMEVPDIATGVEIPSGRHRWVVYRLIIDDPYSIPEILPQSN